MDLTHINHCWLDDVFGQGLQKFQKFGVGEDLLSHIGVEALEKYEYCLSTKLLISSNKFGERCGSTINIAYVPKYYEYMT